MKITIKVPVKPYVRQYLINHYGTDQVVIRSQANDIITSKVCDLLTRARRYNRHELSEEYCDSYTFVIGSCLEHTAGLEVSDDKVIAFNYFVEQLIKERLFILLDALQIAQRIKIKSVINNYIDHNNLLEQGVSYEMLKKAYYRYRTRQQLSVKPWHISMLGIVPKNHKRVA